MITMKTCPQCSTEFDETKLDEQKVYFSLYGISNDYCSLVCVMLAQREISIDGRLEKIETDVATLKEIP